MELNIYDYTDYRCFLLDYCKSKKAENNKYSHRYFAMKAGVRSSGFLSDVMAGKRNLTNRLIPKFAGAMNLNPDQALYFETMVYFNQTKRMNEKNLYFAKMISMTKLKLKTIRKEEYEYYSKWYYSAIRELLYYYRCNENYGELARQLVPSIRPDQARKAIKLLAKLGLIQKKSDGFWAQTEALITTGDQRHRSLHINNFQKETMQLAIRALDALPPDQKDLSTLTLTLSEKSFHTAKSEVAGLRQKLLALAQKDPDVDVVYQINLQMFPLTKIRKKPNV